MLFVNTILLTAIAAVGPSAALVTGRTTQDKYQLVEMTWTGVVEEGGALMNFNGTIESIEAQVKALNPAWTIYNDWYTPDHNQTTEIAKRSRVDQIICDVPGYYPVSMLPINDGIKYLRGLSGSCGVAARSCARISCSYNGAIRLCNDNDFFIQPSCRYMADYAESIVDRCRTDSVECQRPGRNGGICEWDHEVRGQQFDTDNYNIIVALDRC